MPIREAVSGSARLDGDKLTVKVNTKKGPKETVYWVTRLDPHPNCGFPALKLVKSDGSSYELIRTPFGITCSCADYIFCRENTEKKCKHAEAGRACGLL